jgi:hypothetical protein
MSRLIALPQNVFSILDRFSLLYVVLKRYTLRKVFKMVKTALEKCHSVQKNALKRLMRDEKTFSTVNAQKRTDYCNSFSSN